MANEALKNDKIQSSVAEALSRLRGDLSATDLHSNNVGERKEPYFSGNEGSASPDLPSAEIRDAEQAPIADPIEEIPKTDWSNSLMLQAQMLDQQRSVTPPKAIGDDDQVDLALDEQGSVVEHDRSEMPLDDAPIASVSGASQAHQAAKLVDAYMPIPASITGAGDAESDPKRVERMRAEPLFRTPMTAQAAANFQTVTHDAMHERNTEIEMNNPLSSMPPEQIQLGGTATRPAAPRLRYLFILLGFVAVGVVVALLFSGGSDEIPVITADNSQAKVQPLEGQANEVPNQNIEIFEAMKGQGTASSDTEVLSPAPAAPSPIPSAPPNAVGDAGNVTSGSVVAPPPADVATASLPTVTPTIANNPSPQVNEPVTTLPPNTDSTAAPLPAKPAQENTPVSAKGNTPESTAKSTPPVENTPVAVAAKTPTQTVPTKATAWKNSIQLGAVKSESAAKVEWGKLQQKNKDVLGKLNLKTEKVASGGAVLYRILAGPFADRAKANTACTTLKSRGAACIVK